MNIFTAVLKGKIAQQLASKKAPNHKMQLTMGILPVNLNLRHPKVDAGIEVGPDPEIGSHPAHQQLTPDR